MLRRLYDWTMRLAASRHAPAWLAGVAFVEASVFPIPPDVLLIPMVLAARDRAWRFAAIAVAGSVVGAWLGYALGWLLYEEVGRQVIAFYHLQAEAESFRASFAHWGAWVVLVNGAIPIPFKLITISSGIAGLDPVWFTLAALGARSFRFFLVAALFRRYGEPIRDFVERRLSLVTAAFFAVLVGGYLILRLA